MAQKTKKRKSLHVFGSYLRYVRRRAGRRQSEIAPLFGVSQSTLSVVERTKLHCFAREYWPVLKQHLPELDLDELELAAKNTRAYAESIGQFVRYIPTTLERPKAEPVPETAPAPAVPAASKRQVQFVRTRVAALFATLSLEQAQEVVELFEEPFLVDEGLVRLRISWREDDKKMHLDLHFVGPTHYFQLCPSASEANQVKNPTQVTCRDCKADPRFEGLLWAWETWQRDAAKEKL